MQLVMLKNAVIKGDFQIFDLNKIFKHFKKLMNFLLFVLTIVKLIQTLNLFHNLKLTLKG